MSSERFRSICLLTAILTALLFVGGCNEGEMESTPTAGNAKSTNEANGKLAERSAISFIPEDAFAAIVVHPKRIADSDAGKQLMAFGPFKAGLAEIPLNFEDVKRVIVSIGINKDDSESTCVVLELTRKIPQEELLRIALEGAEAKAVELGQTKYFKAAGREGDVLSAWLLNPQTMVVTNESQLRQLLTKPPVESALSRQLKQTDLKHDVVGVLACKNHRDALTAIVQGTAKQLESPELAGLSVVPGHADFVTASFDLSGPSLLKLALQAANAKGADELKGTVEYYVRLLKGMRPLLGDSVKPVFDEFLTGINIESKNLLVSVGAKTPKSLFAFLKNDLKDPAQLLAAIPAKQPPVKKKEPNIPIKRKPEPKKPQKKNKKPPVSKPAKVGKLKFTRLAYNGKNIVRKMRWSENGKHLYLLKTDGVLLKLSVPEFKEVARLELKSVATSLGQSRAGLAALLSSTGEVVVVDETTFKERKRIRVPGATIIATSPKIDAGFAVGGGVVSIVDLKAGRVRARVNGRMFDRFATRVKRPARQVRAGAGFDFAEVTPDGKYLFGASHGSLNRYVIRRFAIKWDEHGHRIGSNPRAIDISPDSKLVCFPSGGGNMNAPNHPSMRGYNTYIYDVSNLQVPKLGIVTGAYPRAVAFDPVSKKIYAQNYDYQLIVVSAGGVIEGKYKLPAPSRRVQETNELLPHPSGNKVLVRTEQALYWCILE